MKHWKKILIALSVLIVVAGATYYQFVEKPLNKREEARKQIYADCAKEARKQAGDTIELRSKISSRAKRTFEADMVYKADIDYGFRLCLRKNGIVDEVVEENVFE